MSRSDDLNGRNAEDGVTDEDLLAMAARGDPDAVARLYDRYRTMTYGLALKITTDVTLAEDVVQDAFVGVWRNAVRYTPERASARTWIMAIVHHRAVDAIRRRRFTTELPEPDAPPPASMVVADVWPEVAQRLDRDAISAALATIAPVQRDAIELAYFSGLTQQEIAARTETPLGTVKSRVRLGLLALRRAMLDQHTVEAPRPARDGGATTGHMSGTDEMRQ